jgi:hypothetical protein
LPERGAASWNAFAWKPGDIDLYGPKAIFCRSDVIESLSESTIQISTAQTGGRCIAIDEQLQERIANEFQPQLLSYRLQNVSKVSTLELEGENLSASTEQLAFIIAASLSEDRELAQETVRLLQAQDEDIRAQQLLDVHRVLVEVLWGLIHKSAFNAVLVKDLANFINVVLQSRGEPVNYSPEEIGWKLSALGIPRHAIAAGREVLLDAANRLRIHKLARAYDLPFAQRVPGCRQCCLKEATDDK